MGRVPTDDLDVRARGIARTPLWFSCLAACALFACGDARSESREPEPARAAGSELPMHAPAANAEEGEQLGVLQPVPVALTAEARAEPAQPAQPTPQPLHVASQPSPQPYPLRKGDLVLPSGLVIHNVPAGVSVRRVDEVETKDSIYELVDARGRRIALLKETALSKVAMPGGPPLLEATAASSAQAKRDWNEKAVDVTTDRFQSESHLYTLERRSTDTDWIMGGLELGQR